MRNGLTQREYDCLEMYLDSDSMRTAGERLGLAEQTVKNALYEARKRVGARHMADLVYRLATGDLERQEP
jgi:DNA-binding CsgD family transcriptional regulator